MKKNLIRVAVIAAAVLVCVLLWVHATQTTWVDTGPYRRTSDAPAEVLVVVYSRTGNTLGAAKAAARFFDADLLRVEAARYPRTLGGQLRASDDADDEVTRTDITHEPVDLSAYELIVLCSPTWWFRPAPPLWAFVAENDFAGRPVFLLMTGNSRLTVERTEKFGAWVESSAGRFLGYHFIRRGRIYWQKRPEEVDAEVQEFLASRGWPHQD